MTDATDLGALLTAAHAATAIATLHHWPTLDSERQVVLAARVRDLEESWADMLVDTAGGTGVHLGLALSVALGLRAIVAMLTRALAERGHPPSPAVARAQSLNETVHEQVVAALRAHRWPRPSPA